MNHRIIKTIAIKDLLEVKQNKSAWISMIVVPLIIVIILPLAFILIPNNIDNASEIVFTSNDLQFFLKSMPDSFTRTLNGLDNFQTGIVLLLGYIFAPFFLIFPLMFSSVIASESFAGEKERKTLEALLYTPVPDKELFLGKVFAAFIPAVLITWASFFIYCVVINASSFQIFNKLWFPLPSWYPLIFWVAPAMSLLAIAVTVLISAKTQTFMGAYQTSASLVVIVVGLIGGQISGILYLDVITGFLVGLIFWAIAIVLTNICIRKFNRFQLIQGTTK